MTIEILGRVPSKKNSRQQIRVHGRTINIPSKAYAAWHRDASYQIARLRPVTPLDRCEIAISFYVPDRRRTDLTNKAESVMDLLVDGGIIADDSWQVVPEMTLRFAGVDRAAPRAIVTLLPLAETTPR